MNHYIEYISMRSVTALAAAMLLALSGPVTAQEDSNDDAAEEEPVSVVDNEFSLGLYVLGDDSFRFGKYSGLTEDGAYALLDFRWEKRPEWNSGDPVRWRFQGWRLGLDSRRLQFDWSKQGQHRFRAEYRQTPNNLFRDGLTPYQGLGTGELALPSGWQTDPNNSWTSGFIDLDQSLRPMKMSTERKSLALTWDMKISDHWDMAVDFRHERKDGVRGTWGIFGSGWTSARSVEIPAPVDWTTDNLKLMFNYANGRARFGAGLYTSFFRNDDTALTWQNAYSRVGNWDPSVAYPNGQGRMSLEPENHFLQLKAYGGFVFNAKTRLTADLSWGSMEQDDMLLPYTLNPNLRVREDLPRPSADAKIETTYLSLRLTSRLARRLNLVAGYRYDDRDNKTPQDAWRYVAADSEDQVRASASRFNLPYSYRRQTADLLLNWNAARGIGLKGGVEWNDYSRSFTEVEDSDETALLAGVRLASWQTVSASLDFRHSERDVDEYVGNRSFQESWLPGAVPPDAWQNHPWQRKYNQTDRERDEWRLRLDWYPAETFSAGLTGMSREDDYGQGHFGLNEAESQSWTVDLAWTPRQNLRLSGYYTREDWESNQSARTIFSFTPSMAYDPRNDWWADTEDDARTWNLHFGAQDLGEAGKFAAGLDYTVSNVDSTIRVTGAERVETLPLPVLVTDLAALTLYGSVQLGERSRLVARIEKSDLDAEDFALDNVSQDTLLKVLSLGQSAQDYEVLLLSLSWNYRF